MSCTAVVFPRPDRPRTATVVVSPRKGASVGWQCTRPRVAPVVYPITGPVSSPTTLPPQNQEPKNASASIVWYMSRMRTSSAASVDSHAVSCSSAATSKVMPFSA